MHRIGQVLKLGVAAAFGALTAGGGAVADDAKDFFKGKTAMWYVGTSPGGGHDFYARVLGKHLPKYLPGLTVVTVNRPGAGHIIAANIINASKPDGLSFGSFSTGLIYSQIMKTPGIKFELEKMSWIGKASNDTRTMIVSKKAEFNSFEELLTAKRPVKFSTSGIGAGSYIDSFLTAKAFNIPHKLIVGYSGGASMLGLMRGETDVLQGGSESGMEYVRDGAAKMILQFGNKVPNVPNAEDYAKTSLQKALVSMLVESGKLARLTAGPPGIPADRLAVLRAAYMETVKDKEVNAIVEKAQRDIDPAPGDEVHGIIVKILNQPPEIMAMLEESNKAAVEERQIVLVKHTGPVTKVESGGGTVSIMHEGQEVSAKLSGSRTAVTIAGAKGNRKAIAVGMTCIFEYEAAGEEAKSVDCK